MGKYILVEFDSDEAADRLRAQIDAASAKGKAFRIAGVFKKPPQKRCECVGVTAQTFKGRSRNDRIVKRHKTTGFYYCTQCKRVRKGWQSPRNELDPLGLPANFFSQGMDKEATLHLTFNGELRKNFPLTTRTTPRGEPVREYEESKKKRRNK